MKQTKRNHIIAGAALLALLIQMLMLPAFGQLAVFDQKNESPAWRSTKEETSKISPDLEQRSDELARGLQSDSREKVIIQLRSETGLNDMYGNNLPTPELRQIFADEVRSNRFRAAAVRGTLSQNGGSLKKSFENLGLVSAELPLSAIKKLAESADVEFIAPDREISSMAGYHVSKTTGAEDAHVEFDGRYLGGSNIGVAVLDSGIDSTHILMQPYASYLSSDGVTVYPANPGLVYSKDFTGQATTADNFGHGTHVATMLHGNKNKLSGVYRGTAWASKLLNLRVLNDKGQGSASTVAAAIDWAITNKATYNLRVLNLSFGAIAKDSYKTDPMCLAVRRATNAGIVVVVAAGNDGKDANGNKIYGGIHTPGIEPTAITVGAVNTYGTDLRADDSVASFSSRGPTRGYTTLSNGSRKYDNLIKPDIVAPGNKLIGGASVASQSKADGLYTKYPTLRTGTTTGTSQLIYLSGTSMAAPQVAGAAALLIEANPTLTPNLVKAMLMYSATQIIGANSLEQGAGMLNSEGSMKIAEVMKPNLAGLTNGSAMLVASLPSPHNEIDAEKIYWSKGILTNFVYLTGDELMTKWQGMYGNGVVMGDGTPYSNGVISKSTTLTTSGVIMGDGVLVSDGVIMGDGHLFVSGVVMGDGTAIGQGVVMGDGVIMGDGTPRAANTLFGDNTACMQPE